MKKLLWQSLAPLVALIAIVGCSTSSNLRKFQDDDISREVSADLVKKFEVKDVNALPAATPIHDVVPLKAVSKKKARKGKVMPSPTPVIGNVPPIRRVDPTPFQVGEKLEYGIRYVGVTAGYLNLEILPNKIINDRNVFHLHARARTVKIFELVYRVDDSIESFWDYDGLFSHRFTMDLDESKQSRKLIELYDYDKKQSFYWNRVDHTEKGFSETKQQFDIELWSQDVLSSLYYLRVVNLPSVPGIDISYPVILDGKPWRSIIRFLRKEKIYAGGRDFMANVYRLENTQNGELKNKDNTLWISDDEHRYVLRVEAKVKVGSFAVALDKIL